MTAEWLALLGLLAALSSQLKHYFKIYMLMKMQLQVQQWRVRGCHMFQAHFQAGIGVTFNL